MPRTTGWVVVVVVYVVELFMAGWFGVAACQRQRQGMDYLSPEGKSSPPRKLFSGACQKLRLGSLVEAGEAQCKPPKIVILAMFADLMALPWMILEQPATFFAGIPG